MYDNVAPPPPTRARGPVFPRPARTSVGFVSLPGTVRTYTVQPGDTLRGIAQQFYNAPHEWPRIYNANRADKGGTLSDPNVLTAGQRVIVP